MSSGPEDNAIEIATTVLLSATSIPIRVGASLSTPTFATKCSMAESITTTIFGAFFPDESSGPGSTANVNAVNSGTTPSASFPSTSFSTTFLATTSITPAVLTSLPNSSTTHTNRSFISISSNTASSVVAPSSLGFSANGEPTTLQRQPLPSTSRTGGTAVPINPEPSQKKPVTKPENKKLSFILGLSLGIVLCFTVLFTSLFILHRRRKTARQARADQEKAQVYSYPYTIPTVNNQSSDLDENSNRALGLSFFSTSSPPSPWSGGTVMPKKLASGMTSYSASWKPAPYATSMRPCGPSQDAFHRDVFRDHSMNRLGRGGRGVELTQLEPPPPDYGT